jgi:hypothetical protein
MAAANPGKTPTSARPYSGVTTPSDPTNQPGQYPVGDWGTAIFGGQLPAGTGAPGSGRDMTEPIDPTNEPGQTVDGLTGITHQEITSTGAPGTQGTVPDTDAGGDGTTFTITAASDGINPYRQVTMSDELSGPQDSTQANDDGYATGGPQLPALQGNEPQAGQGRYQPGAGRVLRGGRMVHG